VLVLLCEEHQSEKKTRQKQAIRATPQGTTSTGVNVNLKKYSQNILVGVNWRMQVVDVDPKADMGFGLLTVLHPPGSGALIAGECPDNRNSRSLHFSQIAALRD
jgi:hypothetical protein